jgi:hypothetical protein
LDLAVAAENPLFRMSNHTCTHHVKIDVDQTLQKMSIGVYRCRMIAILPEGTFASFPLVVLLACPSVGKLHRSWNGCSITGISHQQVHVIRSHHLIQYHQAVALLRLPKPLQIPATIFGKF